MPVRPTQNHRAIITQTQMIEDSDVVLVHVSYALRTNRGKSGKGGAEKPILRIKFTAANGPPGYTPPCRNPIGSALATGPHSADPAGGTAGYSGQHVPHPPGYHPNLPWNPLKIHERGEVEEVGAAPNFNAVLGGHRRSTARLNSASVRL